MNRRSDAQIIEVLHLLFLQVLTAHSRDWFLLKGGANLRYFFGSVRYSNDIDLDFFGKKGWQVERSVDAVLAGRALGVLLGQHGLQVKESTKPKQTETTRRWKLGIARHDATSDLVRTKIEFSNRGAFSDDHLYETIPRQVVDPYAIRPATMSHYGQVAALEQKIAALALRSETKARDVFDLELLFRLRRASGQHRGVDVSHAPVAAQRALEITDSSFRSEVVPFLDPDIAALYDGEEQWEIMRTMVSDEIKALIIDGGTRGHS
jgi:predicted nucleotidyltransferase component of viral defense system